MVAPLPQVDLVSSVPTRAADAMFWLGRAAERAEAVARTARVISSRRQTDPSLATYDGGRWALRMAHVLRVARGEPLDIDGVEGRPIVVLDHELSLALRAVSERLTTLLAEAATVGEYLSVTAGRVLRNMAVSRNEFADGRAPIDALDACIADLAAFIGLWDESTVRGPAWRFGDIGRRIERSRVVLGLVDACLRRVPAQRSADGAVAPGVGAAPPAMDSGDVVDRASLEVLLAANESLVAYRRHHRSDVELTAATHLLLLDADNPRSYLSCIGRLAEHVAAVDWPEGRRDVAGLAGLVGGDDVLDGAAAALGAVDAFAGHVIDAWFATPVNPMVVRGHVR
jgi:uncharacterized alpha-E superfamily protein